MAKITFHKTDHQVEKQLVTAMIVSDKFLQGVQSIYNPDLMVIPFAKTVASWCMDYWNQYGKAPGLNIQLIFESHSREDIDSEQVDLIGNFLEGLSEAHERAERLNSEYLLDQAEKRFKERSLDMLAEDIIAHRSRQENAECENLVRGYRQVERPTSYGINPLTDKDAIIDALEYSDRDILFKMPGALGRFLGPFERDMLIGIMGMEKAGKSFWLMEFAMRAVRSLCNVAYFIVGDMTQKQVVRRIGSYVTGKNHKRAGLVQVPVLDCFFNQNDSCRKRSRICDFGVLEEDRGEVRKLSLDEAPNYVPCTHCMRGELDSHPLNPRDYKGAVWYKMKDVGKLAWRDALAVGEKFSRRIGGRSIKQVTVPSGGVNIQEMRTYLGKWEEEGFIPDVIVVDYADNLAPEDPRKDPRHQINETWMSLRALSQEHHCLVMTATQTAASSYEKKRISPKDFSEDKRKYGHVNMMITLNQTDRERSEGTMRIGKMFVREDEPDNRVCTVLECRSIARPYLGSFL